MNIGELFRLYFERSEALQSYWTLYVVVIGGLLAFSSLRKQPARLTTVLISILYICFASKNLGAIRETTMQRQTVHQEILSMPMGEPDQRIAATLVSPAYPGVRNFHVFSDVLTLVAVWAMEWRRRHGTPL